MTALDEPSPSLAHLQARQRLAWAAGLHPRLGMASATVGHVDTALYTKIGQRPPVVQPGHNTIDGMQLDARTSTTRGAVRGETRGVDAWHVARAARSLHALPLCSSVETNPDERREYRRIVDRLAARLMGWHAQFSGRPHQAHFYNKTSFMHEMEEVLLPLRVLVAMRGLSPLMAPVQLEPLPRPQLELEPEPDSALEPERIIVVDLCAGKGFLPMCLANGAVVDASDSGEAVTGIQISSVLLIEKARVNWAHLHDSETWVDAPNIEIWGPPREKTNIFDESLVERLAQLPGKLLLVGIHLCRRLSSRAIEIFNLLGPHKTAGLVLAPCCLPTASGVIEIAALARRMDIRGDFAGQRTEADSGPLTIMPASHSLWDNPISKAWSAPNAVHCWNCGDVGHLKDDCPSPPSGLTRGQIRRRRKFGNRRTAASIDTERVVTSSRPFQTWVDALFAGIDCLPEEKTVTVLPCADSDARPEHDDGQAQGGTDGHPLQLERKMTWLVAIRGRKLETDMPWLCHR